MATAGNFPSKVANKSRANMVGRDIAQPKELFALLGWVALLLGFLISCTTPFDMSDERITAPGPDWGVVIGSVLVRPVEMASDKNAAGRDVLDSSYEFDIVPVQPGDPN